MRRSAFLIAVIAFIGSIAPAHAAPITYYAIASAGVTVFPTGGGSSETLQVDSQDSAGPANAAGTDAISGATGTAYAWVDDAILHAAAYSSTGGASAGGTASYFDTLTVTSSTLTTGSFVDFLFEVDLSYSLTGCGNVVYGAIDVSTYTAGPAAIVQERLCGSAGENIFNPSRILQLQVGDVFTINAYLTAAVGGFTPGSADASNTMSFFITPLGDDYGYSAASGNNFARVTPVPEPASMLLLGTGLLGAGVRRWRQKRA